MGSFPTEFVISGFVTLFVVVDPIGLAPAFLVAADGLPLAVQFVIDGVRAVLAG